MEQTAMVMDIQRFSIHDGPGIRTTVFLKGCHMSCLWCHNPESQYAKPQLMFYEAQCIGCGRCVDVCWHEGIEMKEKAAMKTDKCIGCGYCFQVCPTGALHVEKEKILASPFEEQGITRGV